MGYGTPGGRLERAHRLGHVPVMHNTLVAERMRHYALPDRATAAPIPPAQLHPEIAAGTPPRRWVIAVDGSTHEQEVRPEYPATRAAFVQFAVALVDTTAMAGVREDGFPNPVRMHEAADVVALNGFLPSSGLVLGSGGTTPTDAFRAELRHLFATTSVEGMSLLTLLQRVFEAAGRTRGGDRRLVMDQCPCCRAPADGGLEIPVRPLVGSHDLLAPDATCPRCDGGIFATDVLRLHESFRPYEANGEVLGRLMNLIEHLVLVGALLRIRRQGPGDLSGVVFLRDGPLALFGEVAPLKTGVLRLWREVAAEVAGCGLAPPICVGVEKSGQIVDHARAMRERIPCGALLSLPIDYVATYLKPGADDNYHTDTYWGRSFIYRARSGAVHVLTVPPLGEAVELPWGPRGSADPADYPGIDVACEMCDRLGTLLYEDALLPIVLAHRHAAFPLRTAEQVLHLFASRQLGAPAPAPVS